MLATLLLTCAAWAPAQDPVPESFFPTEAVDALFTRWDTEDEPGFSMAIIQEGEIVYVRGFGLANLEHRVPNGPDTVFRIASTSKQFTAACIALLSLDGKLELDEGIHHWIPELPDYGTPITIGQLCHHTSGLSDYLELMDAAGIGDHDNFSAKDALELLAQRKTLDRPPGERFVYCNSGYFLLGLIVERASGKSLRDFAQERLFEPLGMTSTHYHDDRNEVVPHRAYGYRPKRGGGFKLAMTGLEIVGDGGLFTTVRDLAIWDRNFYTPEVGGQAFLTLMHQTGVLNDGKPNRYAMGLSVRTWKGTPMISHAGAYVGFNADMMRLPDLRTTVICLANRGDLNPSRRCLDVLRLLHPDQRSDPRSSGKTGR